MPESPVAGPAAAPPDDARAVARERLRRNAGHIADDLSRMAANAVRLGFTPAEIAALYLGHSNVAEAFAPAPRQPAGG